MYFPPFPPQKKVPCTAYLDCSIHKLQPDGACWNSCKTWYSWYLRQTKCCRYHDYKNRIPHLAPFIDEFHSVTSQSGWWFPLASMSDVHVGITNTEHLAYGNGWWDKWRLTRSPIARARQCDLPFDEHMLSGVGTCAWFSGEGAKLVFAMQDTWWTPNLGGPLACRIPGLQDRAHWKISKVTYVPLVSLCIRAKVCQPAERHIFDQNICCMTCPNRWTPSKHSGGELLITTV